MRKLPALLTLLSLLLASQPLFADFVDGDDEEEVEEEAEPEAPKGDPVQYAREFRSPRVGVAPSRADAAVHKLCGVPELGLTRVASRLLGRQLDGKAPYGASEIKQLVRAEGIPQVFPRALMVRTKGGEKDLLAQVGRWAGAKSHGQRRCGLARGVDASGATVAALVSVEALADLLPLPTRVRTHGWVSLDAVMNVPVGQVQVALLGPRGRPRRVLGGLVGKRLRSRFTLDQPGRWVVQVLGATARGPEPLLEAEIFAGSAPPTHMGAASSRAPMPQHAGGLVRLLRAERRREGLARLTRDASLDALALAHATHMRDRGRVAHDLGRGDPRARVAAAGVQVTQVGENVAAAPTVERAHQALWESPSHRENMLDAGYTHVGVGVAKGADGRLWIAELFAR